MAHQNSQCSENITATQKGIILDYMSDHSEFAAGRFVGCNPKQQKKEQTERLAALVSEHGPRKTGEQVKRVWTSMKQKTREYVSKKKSACKTGNNAGDFEEDPFYEKMLQVIGTSHGNGLSLIKESGFGNAKKNGTSRNIVVWEDNNTTSTLEKPINNTVWEATPGEQSTVSEKPMNAFLKCPKVKFTSYNRIVDSHGKKSYSKAACNALQELKRSNDLQEMNLKLKAQDLEQKKEKLEKWEKHLTIMQQIQSAQLQLLQEK